MKNDKRIGIALSGGGMMGIAHVSIIEEMEKNGISPKFISGTSVGAVIGALYAAGGIDQIEVFLAYLDGTGFFKPKLFFWPNTVFSTLKTALEKYLKIKSFEELPKKFICVATDIDAGSEVVLDQGNLIDAIMASCAYPGVFPTQKIAGKNLIDGGIVKNIPVSELKKVGAEFIIGSSLYYTLPKNKGKISRFNTIIRAADIMQWKIAQTEIEKCDFCFTPEISDFHWYKFQNMPKIKKLGQDYAKSHISDLLKKISS